MRTESGCCPRCDALLTDADTEADECTQCGLSLDPPDRVPCCYPDCDKTTTWDTTYGDLCYRHIRADNE